MVGLFSVLLLKRALDKTGETRSPTPADIESAKICADRSIELCGQVHRKFVVQAKELYKTELPWWTWLKHLISVLWDR